MPARADARAGDLIGGVGRPRGVEPRGVDPRRVERPGATFDDTCEPVMRPITVHRTLHKGRGAVGNVRGRYEVDVRESFDDGWAGEITGPEFDEADEVDGGIVDDAAASDRRERADTDSCTGSSARPDSRSRRTATDSSGTEDDRQAPSLKTIVQDEEARSILSRNDSPDIPFRLSLNPYRGCEHGCIYCFARPTHSYLGLSPGLDFESRLFAKVNAAALLTKELGHASYVPDVIAVGVNTDAYQPIERERRITRGVLEVLRETRNPFGLITKSSLIERDLDLLVPLAERNLTRASITITTLDHALSRHLEPRAASPARRLRTVRTLADAGVPVSVNVSPVIPFITDGEMEHIVEAAAAAGAHSAHFIVLRLPWELNEVFQQWLYTHFPLRADRVMARIRDLRGGKDYDARFGKRMTGEGVWTDLFATRFQAACARHGLNRGRRRFDTSQFRRPVPPTARSAQQRLFD